MEIDSKDGDCRLLIMNQAHYLLVCNFVCDIPDLDSCKFTRCSFSCSFYSPYYKLKVSDKNGTCYSGIRRYVLWFSGHLLFVLFWESHFPEPQCSYL